MSPQIGDKNSVAPFALQSFGKSLEILAAPLIGVQQNYRHTFLAVQPRVIDHPQVYPILRDDRNYLRRR